VSRAYFTWQEAILRANLEPTTKLVCHTIGCHMAADGSGCFPSYALIAEESRLNRATVIRHVQKATEAGYLEVTGRINKDGDQTSNLYRPVMPRGVVAQGDPNYPSELPNEHTKRVRRFDEFWNSYPRKVARSLCLGIWKRRGLDVVADTVIAGVKRWNGSDQWQRNIIPNPATFLNQERWKDVPPAAEPKKGELRVREPTPEELKEARERNAAFDEFKRLLRLHPRKSEAEIREMLRLKSCG
jgi:hypothetical protein